MKKNDAEHKPHQAVQMDDKHSKPSKTGKSTSEAADKKSEKTTKKD